MIPWYPSLGGAFFKVIINITLAPNRDTSREMQLSYIREMKGEIFDRERI